MDPRIFKKHVCENARVFNIILRYARGSISKLRYKEVVIPDGEIEKWSPVE
jgi:hypothetical protein